MRTSLIFLGTLRDADVAWLVGAGRKMALAAGDKLVTEGVAFGAVYLILEGRFNETVHGVPLGTLAPGEMVGETSFLDGGKPPTTVTATEASQVLAVDCKRLAQRLDRDEAFGARVYKALAASVADRLRASNVRAASGTKASNIEEKAETEIPKDVLERSTIAASHFTEILKRTGVGQ